MFALLQLVDGNVSSGMLGADQVLTPAQMEAIANSGTAVILQANNDISLLSGSDIVIDNPTGIGGALTLEAGRSITLNSSITTDGSDLSLLANQAPVDPAERDPGPGGITMAAGTTINLGSGHLAITVNPDLVSPNQPGRVKLAAVQAGSFEAQAHGGLTLNGAVVIGSGGGLYSVEYFCRGHRCGWLFARINGSLESDGAIRIVGVSSGEASALEGVSLDGGSITARART